MYRPSVNVIWTQFSLVHDYQNARTVCDKNICIKVEQKKMGVALERENDPNKPIKCKNVARTLSSAHGEE